MLVGPFEFIHICRMDGISREIETQLIFSYFKVFDILPLYGSLMPGESDTVTFTFYGHTEIGSQAKALCHVEGGPCYEINLSGEASVVQYEFDNTFVDYGRQVRPKASSSCSVA